MSLKISENNNIKDFKFNDDNFQKARDIIKKYPSNRQASAIVPLLYLAQHQSNGWLPGVAIEYVASVLGMPPIKAYEVATFYTMFNLEPVGKYFLQVCTTTPCWLAGSDEVLRACHDKLNIAHDETSEDKLFTVKEVECLGACVNAPIVQVTSAEANILDDFYEDLTYDIMCKLIDDLRAGKKPIHGSQIGRQCSAPKEN